MKTRRTIIGAVVALMGVFAVVVAIALASGHRVASGGDPFHLTAERLKGRLAVSGIDITYVDENKRRLEGVARYGRGGPIGFEFRLFNSSDVATIKGIGRLRPSDFGWSKPHLGVTFEVTDRGVLGNVGFAEYELRYLEGRGLSRREIVEAQLAKQRILRGLDDALFSAFPSDDPYVSALSATPE
jgi:hypothetical protein